MFFMLGVQTGLEWQICEMDAICEGRRDTTWIRIRVMDDFRITRDVLLPLLLARRLIECVECL
jgi:hypothetical protein